MLRTKRTRKTVDRGSALIHGQECTAVSNTERIDFYMVSVLGDEPLGILTHKGLQDFLDGKAATRLSFSTVAHLR